MDQMTHSYHVTGITCAGCEKKVKKVLTEIPAVKEVNIDRTSDTVTVTMDTHLSVETLRAALQGYPKYQVLEQKG